VALRAKMNLSFAVLLDGGGGFKKIYLDECQRCSVVRERGGLFQSAERIDRNHIVAIV
jgi:hypothetical protein